MARQAKAAPDSHVRAAAGRYLRFGRDAALRNLPPLFENSRNQTSPSGAKERFSQNPAIITLSKQSPKKITSAPNSPEYDVGLRSPCPPSIRCKVWIRSAHHESES